MQNEILKLSTEIKQNGYTLIPTKVYFSKDYAKIELAICKGKKLYDKRESIKEKEVKRRIDKLTRQNQH